MGIVDDLIVSPVSDLLDQFAGERATPGTMERMIREIRQRVDLAEDREFMSAVADSTFSLDPATGQHALVMGSRVLRKKLRKKLGSASREPTTSEVWADG